MSPGQTLPTIHLLINSNNINDFMFVIMPNWSPAMDGRSPESVNIHDKSSLIDSQINQTQCTGIEIIPKMPLKGLESSVYLYLIINDVRLKDNGDRNGGMSTIPVDNSECLGLFKTLIQIENNKTFLCWLAGLANAKINFRRQFIISDIEWGLEGLELLSMTP